MGSPPRTEGPPFAGHRVVLGVTGGIAAFKAIHLARELTLAGAEVDVCLTEAACEFVQPLSFEALTGRPVYAGLYEPGDPLLHIRLAREADAVVVAPATANCIARLAAGMGDDLLTTLVLATMAPVVVAPAMNDRMFAHPATQRNLKTLGELGYRIAGPAEGLLAWDEGSGPGRMLEPEALVAHVARALYGETPLCGKKVVVTAGPTREAADPVRFLGNRSSGKMGYAIAAEAWRRGARVTLVSGPTALDGPEGVDRVEVESAEQMLTAVRTALADADVLIMAAAVADFRPARPAGEKIKKGAETFDTLALEPTPDVLRTTLSDRPDGLIAVGFALETGDAVEKARAKLKAKQLDLIVVNDATEEGSGFEVDTNRVTLLHRSAADEALPLISKKALAGEILDRVSRVIDGSDG